MPALVGVVLCGGASRRMGRDKATIGDPPWAHRVARALLEGGCERVELQGGHEGLATESFTHFPDIAPGTGPAPALVQSAARNRGSALVVAACDLPELRGADVAALASNLERQPGVHPRGPDTPRVHAYRVEGVPAWSLLAFDAATVAHFASMDPSAAKGTPLRAMVGACATLHDPEVPETVTDIDEPGGVREPRDRREGTPPLPPRAPGPLS